ncbi:MAG: cyclase family protein [Desulfotomaculales bacterium]|jgi:kynurenine formamidase
MRLIDLSVYTEENPYAELFPPSIKLVPHQEEAKMLSAKMGVDVSVFPDGCALSHEDVVGSFHIGTHVDAPLHFGPVIAGQKARGIDQMPLEWFFQDGVRLDLRHVPRKALITKEHILAALAEINYTLKPLDIVLLWTGFDKFIYGPEYLAEQPGMSREATEYLLDQGIKVIGIDCWGFDRPFAVMAEEVKKGNPGALFPGHFIGREKEYCHIEKLGNLEQLPVPFGFKVAAFPQKVRNGTAGAVRVVAILED